MVGGKDLIFSGCWQERRALFVHTNTIENSRRWNSIEATIEFRTNSGRNWKTHVCCQPPADILGASTVSYIDGRTSNLTRRGRRAGNGSTDSVAAFKRKSDMEKEVSTTKPLQWKKVKGWRRRGGVCRSWGEELHDLENKPSRAQRGNDRWQLVEEQKRRRKSFRWTHTHRPTKALQTSSATREKSQRSVGLRRAVLEKRVLCVNIGRPRRRFVRKPPANSALWKRSCGLQKKLHSYSGDWTPKENVQRPSMYEEPFTL